MFEAKGRRCRRDSHPGDRAELQDGVNGGRKARSHADDLISGFDRALAEAGRGQGGERNQIGRRAGIDGEQIVHAEKFRQPLFEFVVETPGGEPAVERGFDHVPELGGADHLAGGGDDGGAGDEGLGLERDVGEIVDTGRYQPAVDIRHGRIAKPGEDFNDEIAVQKKHLIQAQMAVEWQTLAFEMRSFEREGVFIGSRRRGGDECKANITILVRIVQHQSRSCFCL